MIKLGPMPTNMREMSFDDIFLSRLKLLIIMVKASLIGYPLGKYRKRAIIENANYVFYRAVQLNTEAKQKRNHIFVGRTNAICIGETSESHLFQQRVQLLAVMAKALAEGCPTGEFRIRAMNENLDKICETFLIDFQLNDMSFLKVA
jgi:hypothetical protein